uniref:Uncharacterized protein n=1 Tax=viral metagenome TaxID=1070528 RepID=A0A6M3M0H4_9ZZZZ
MADVIKDTVDTKQLTSLSSTAAKVSTTRPSVTKTKVGKAITLLRDVEGNGGYLGIAQEVGLTKLDVKLIHRDMQRRISELTPSEVVETK